MNQNHFPQALYSQILPGLWQGGTRDHDVVGSRNPQPVTKAEFDTVVTCYGSASPADWGVREYRLGFYDGDMRDFDPMVDLLPLVAQAHQDWKSGKKVLIRCQAGLNRSGLVMALVLMRDGYSPEEAIDLIRAQRGPDALFNRTFTKWLINDAHPSFWNAPLAA